MHCRLKLREFYCLIDYLQIDGKIMENKLIILGIEKHLNQHFSVRVASIGSTLELLQIKV